MQALIYLAVAGISLLMIVVGIALYTKLTNSGPRFRSVVAHKIRELDPQQRANSGSERHAAQSDVVRSRRSRSRRTRSDTVMCEECHQQVAAGRFCVQCGSPLFGN